MRLPNPLRVTQFQRRRLLQLGLGASAAAALPRGGFAPRSALAQSARENEMNLFTWEGYNSDEVLDPFRREFDTRVNAEGLISDPDAVNRLRAGETAVWDVINLNNSWARKQLYPENLIVPLEQERFRPYWDMALPAFEWPYHWAMSDDGTELLGIIQRFGPSGCLINTNEIAKETFENEGYGMFLEDGMAGRYAVLMYDDWVIMHACLAAGFSPFREHTDAELATFDEVITKVIANAAFLSDDLNSINLGLINGSIIGSFPGSVYTASTARFDGATNIRCVVPLNGPAEIEGKNGVVWIELTSLVNNPQLSPRGADFLEYLQRPEVCKAVAFAEGTYNPVVQMGDPKVMDLFDADELEAIQWDTMEEDIARCAEFDEIPDYDKLHAMFSAAVRARGA